MHSVESNVLESVHVVESSVSGLLHGASEALSSLVPEIRVGAGLGVGAGEGVGIAPMSIHKALALSGAQGSMAVCAISHLYICPL
ncbi:unnamed protein product [Sphagnum tenellum]